MTFSLIERLLGGTGNKTAFEHEFTEIEVSLMAKIFNQIAIFTGEAWANLLEVESQYQQIETNARLIQSMPMEEIVVIVMMDVSIGAIKGTMSFSIPCINLEGILEQLNKNKMLPKRQLDQTQEELLRDIMLGHVRNSTLELHGVLGETQLTIQEITSLQVGDVVRFDQPIGKNVKVLIGEKAWFYGSLGSAETEKRLRLKKSYKICFSLSYSILEKDKGAVSGGRCRGRKRA